MKKLGLNNLVIAVLIVSATFISCNNDEYNIDCDDDIDKAHLLETIIRSDGSIYRKFEYDNENRIQKIISFHEEGFEYTNTFYYNEDDLVKVSDNYYVKAGEYYIYENAHEIEFSKREDKIIFSEKHSYSPDDIYITTLELNSEGYPIGIIQGLRSRDYNITKSNLTSYLYMGFSSGGAGTSTETFYEYKYDNKKSPFYNCKTPQWYLIYEFLELGSQNNATEILKTFNGSFSESKTTTKIKYIYDCAGFPIKRTETIDGEITDILEFKYK